MRRGGWRGVGGGGAADAERAVELGEKLVD
jgi:hypothetical protein